MKVWALASLLAGFVIYGTALAADPLTIQLSSLEEEPGRISATITVIGPDGRPITGLGTPNFKATLGDTPLNVSDLLGSSAARQAASVVLVVDVSGSMGGEPITQARAAMQDFVRVLDPGDRVAIVTFGTRVTQWQDFTSDRAVLNQSISRITVAGETALYDGVQEGLKKISEAPSGRRLVVVLSDGSASLGLEKRAATLEAAAATGVNVVTLGFGTQIDRAFLTEVAEVSGGRFIQANTTIALRQAYADIANAVRSQYTVVLSVPSTADRTVPARLKLQVTLRTDTGTIERQLGPLPGAVAPPFDLKVGGIEAGQKLSSQAALPLAPSAAAGISLTRVDYVLDDQPLHSATTAPFTYSFDPAALAPGSHLMTVKAWEAGGRTGEAQVAFTIAAPASGSPVSSMLLVVLLVIALAGALAFVILRKKKPQIGTGAGRIRPFARRAAEPALHRIEDWPMPAPAPKPAAPPPDRALGRIVVLDEAAVRSGNLDAIREYEIKTQPLTLGTGDDCDIQIEDEQGRIAAEEARLWVQKGRLVYHKLTTLSAMATEGVTSGWEFLESGEEMHLGPYRILFEEYGPELPQDGEDPASPAPEGPLKPAQEHGMTLSDLWTRVRDETQLPQSSE